MKPMSPVNRRIITGIIIAIVSYTFGYTIGEGDGYCHAKYSDNPAVCDVP